MSPTGVLPSMKRHYYAHHSLSLARKMEMLVFGYAGARVLALADAWDAITSPRPYRASLSSEEAMVECRRVSGLQFCPRVVSALETLAASDALPKRAQAGAAA